MLEGIIRATGATGTNEAAKAVSDLVAELEDAKEALMIAVRVAEELLEIGKPEVRNRRNLLAWEQLEVTVRLLSRELHKH